MAGSNQLIVEVIGDTKRLTADLRVAQQQINRFASTSSRVRSTGADPLLADVRAMQARAAGLQDSLANVEPAALRAERSIRSVGVGALAAGIGVNLLGRNLEQLGGQSARVGDALTSLTSGDLVGFAKAVTRTDVDVKKFTADLIRTGDASRANEVANAAAAKGFDDVAAAARNAATSIRSATDAFVDNTKIHDSTSVGAIQSEVSSKPLPKPRKGLTAAQRNRFFDSALSRDIDRVQDLGLRKQVAALREIAKEIEARIAVTKDITRKLRLEDELVQVNRQRKSVEATIAKNARQAARDAAEAAAALKAQRIAREKALAEARKNAEQARQFKALGFDAEGNKPTPTIGNLTKQLNQLDVKVTGGKNQQILNAIRRVLTDPVHRATEETRQAIRDMFAGIRNEFDKGGSKPIINHSVGLNTNKVLEGLGLSSDESRRLRARLSHVSSTGQVLPGSATTATGGSFVGGRPIIIENHTTVELDGKTVAKSVTRNQQRARGGNPTQRRGPNRGS